MVFVFSNSVDLKRRAQYASTVTLSLGDVDESATLSLGDVDEIVHGLGLVAVAGCQVTAIVTVGFLAAVDLGVESVGLLDGAVHAVPVLAVAAHRHHAVLFLFAIKTIQSGAACS